MEGDGRMMEVVRWMVEVVEGVWRWGAVWGTLMRCGARAGLVLETSGDGVHDQRKGDEAQTEGGVLAPLCGVVGGWYVVGMWREGGGVARRDGGG